MTWNPHALSRHHIKRVGGYLRPPRGTVRPWGELPRPVMYLVETRPPQPDTPEALYHELLKEHFDEH